VKGKERNLTFPLVKEMPPPRAGGKRKNSTLPFVDEEKGYNSEKEFNCKHTITKGGRQDPAGLTR